MTWKIKRRITPYFADDTMSYWSNPDVGVLDRPIEVEQHVLVAWTGEGWPTLVEVQQGIIEARKRFWYDKIVLQPHFPKRGDTLFGVEVWS